jgi:hypothetical protein
MLWWRRKERKERKKGKEEIISSFLLTFRMLRIRKG